MQLADFIAELPHIVSDLLTSLLYLLLSCQEQKYVAFWLILVDRHYRLDRCHEVVALWSLSIENFDWEHATWDVDQWSSFEVILEPLCIQSGTHQDNF